MILKAGGDSGQGLPVCNTCGVQGMRLALGFRPLPKPGVCSLVGLLFGRNGPSGASRSCIRNMVWAPFGIQKKKHESSDNAKNL